MEASLSRMMRQAEFGIDRARSAPARSTDPADYQALSAPIVVMAKGFPAGARTGRHSHPRAQLLHAIAGSMLAETDGGT
ncbi:MAG: hypothetical protein OHK0024_26730 [Thalassobaculales bacterium]